MATDTKSFRTAVISPESLVAQVDVVAVQIPAYDGMIGILNHRAPLLTRLGTGILQLDLSQGQPQKYLITGGYAQMKDNTLNILTDEAVPVSQITPGYRTQEAGKLAALTGSDAITSKLREKQQQRLAAIDRYLSAS